MTQKLMDIGGKLTLAPLTAEEQTQRQRDAEKAEVRRAEREAKRAEPTLLERIEALELRVTELEK